MQPALAERPSSELTRVSPELSRAAGQPGGKGRPLPSFACHSHVAAHHTCELARNGQTETCPAVLPSGRGIRLGEFFEQLRLLLRRHSDAGVRNRELYPRPLVDHFADKQCHLTLLCEFASIAQEVEQDLSQPHGVDGERTKALLAFDHEAVVILLGKGPRRVDDLIDQGTLKPPNRG